MIPLTLWYSHDQATGDIARTHAELDAALDRLAALSGPAWPALAEVTQTDNKRGPLLYVGVHVDLGALLYSGDDDEVGSFTKGQGQPVGEPILYMYMTSASEAPPNAEVPAALVRQAAHEFADTGLRPTCVDWQPADPHE
jgi:hypothetical protein